MPQIWCESCAAGKQAGERIVFEGFTEPYEQPPEYERVIFGKSLPPAKDKCVRVGSRGHMVTIPVDENLCDNCNALLTDGACVCCLTVYSKDFPEPLGWETAHIDIAPEDKYLLKSPGLGRFLESFPEIRKTYGIEEINRRWDRFLKELYAPLG